MDYKFAILLMLVAMWTGVKADDDDIWEPDNDNDNDDDDWTSNESNIDKRSIRQRRALPDPGYHVVKRVKRYPVKRNEPLWTNYNQRTTRNAPVQWTDNTKLMKQEIGAKKPSTASKRRGPCPKEGCPAIPLQPAAEQQVSFVEE